MLLRAAVVPPAEVREGLARIVAATPQPGIRPVPVDQVHVVLAQLGNIPPGDVERLVRTSRDSMADLGAGPTLRVAGGSVVRERSYEVVAAELVGELDRFREVATDLGVVAASQRLFVDRRRFQPAFAVALLDPGTPAERAAPLLDALQAHQGRPWQVAELVLMKGGWSDAHAMAPDYEPWERFPFVG